MSITAKWVWLRPDLHGLSCGVNRGGTIGEGGERFRILGDGAEGEGVEGVVRVDQLSRQMVAGGKVSAVASGENALQCAKPGGNALGALLRGADRRSAVQPGENQFRMGFTYPGIGYVIQFPDFAEKMEGLLRNRTAGCRAGKLAGFGVGFGIQRLARRGRENARTVRGQCSPCLEVTFALGVSMVGEADDHIDKDHGISGKYPQEVCEMGHEEQRDLPRGVLDGTDPSAGTTVDANGDRWFIVHIKTMSV